TAGESLEASVGLNKPYITQYGMYITASRQGDLGTSIRSTAAIATETWPYIGAACELTFFAMLFAVVVGVNTGIISAWKQNSLFDLLAMLVALLGVSMPVFWFALMEQWIFAQELSWLPAHGRYDPRNPLEAI